MDKNVEPHDYGNFNFQVEECGKMLFQSYDPKTGRILYSGENIPSIIDLLIERGESIILGEGNDSAHYVDINQSPPVIRPRPKQEARCNRTELVADGEDALVLSGLPLPCTVQIGEHRYGVEDGELEWSTLMPGTYYIHVEAFPYLDWDAEVSAIASGASPDEG